VIVEIDEPGSTQTEQVCSGVIIDATHILTAAHCLYYKGVRIPLSQYLVSAGIDEYDSNADLSTLQQPPVSTASVFPGYVLGQQGDDLGLITLATPLTFDGPDVAPIARVAAAKPPDAGTAVTLYGWGWTTTTGPDGFEHSVALQIDSTSTCRSGLPAVMCASSPTGTGCQGDSGAGLVALDPQPTLVGIEDATVGKDCVPGNVNVYADLSSPGIIAWLNGNSNPPLAPRTSYLPTLTSPARVNGELACGTPNWSGNPKVTFEFVDTTSNVVLQNGTRPVYAIKPAELHHRIQCIVAAQDAGGTTYSTSHTVIVTASVRK